MHIIINNEIREFPNAPDTNLYDYDVLEGAELAFYLANPTASLSEVNAMQLTVYVPTLAELKQAKMNEFFTAAGTVFAQGYYDKETGWTLYLDDEPINDYAKIKAVLLDLEDTDAVDIPTHGGWQATTKSVAFPLLVRYGKFTMPLLVYYKKLQTSIETATTKDELDAITW